MPIKGSVKKMRNAFKATFNLSEGGAGNQFNKQFLKEKAKTKEGLDEIRSLYDKFQLTFPQLSMQQGSLADMLDFKVPAQRRVVESLQNLHSDFNNNRKIQEFLLSVGMTKPSIIQNYAEVAKDVYGGELQQREMMGKIEKAKIKLADGVQEKGEAKVDIKEAEKIAKSIVETAVTNAIEEIEKNQDKKVTSDQKEIITEQIEKEVKNKIKESAKSAIPIEDIEDVPIDLPRSKPKPKSKAKVQLEMEDEPTRTEASPTIGSEPTTTIGSEPMTAEDIAEEKKAQADARASRPTSGMTDEQEQELFDIPQPPSENVKMKMKKPDMRSEIDDLQPLPSKADFIPPMRLGTRGKDIKDLLEDIAYFMKNFKGQLKREAEIFKEVDKTNIEQLRKLHGRIVGKLAPKQKKEGDKKIGIIVNADEYIREQMKKILQEQTFSSLRPQDVVIDVGSKASEGRDTKDFGDFAVKRTIDGGLASTREAVYRYMPSENDDQVGEEGKTEKQRKKPNRITMPAPRLNNRRTTAIRMNVQNPFRVPQKTMKLKYLY